MTLLELSYHTMGQNSMAYYGRIEHMYFKITPDGFCWFQIRITGWQLHFTKMRDKKGKQSRKWKHPVLTATENLISEPNLSILPPKKKNL